MESTTRSSSATSPRSQSCAIATAPTGFVLDSHSVSESGVIATPGRASPNAASATTRPRRDTYSCAPGCSLSPIPRWITAAAVGNVSPTGSMVAV
jgi:hypothetical protein